MSSTPSPLKIQLYQAGAGAGKTHKLTETIIESAKTFKAQQGRFPRIVVTTFTRKATQELRERLMIKADDLGDPELTSFLVSPSHVHISTIHGVLHMFLSRYGHVFGIDPAFEIVDQWKNVYLAKRALKNILFTNESFQDLLEDYDINLIVQMLLGYSESMSTHQKLRPLTLSDMEKTLADLRNETSKRAKVLSEQVSVEAKTPKWLEFASILKEFAAYFDAPDWSSSRAKLIDHLDGFRKPPFKKDDPPILESTKEEVDAFFDDIKEFKKDIFDPVYWNEFISTIERFTPLARLFSDEFRNLKKREGCLSMTDLELATLEGIQENPMTAESFSAEWDFWLIDEFQDTSPLQSRILSQLIGRSPYFVVGDPQQSIYLFRGARSEVFQEQRLKVENTDGQIHSLTKNYRSTPQLVSFFNEFFTRLSSSFTKMESASTKVNQAKHTTTFFKAVDEKQELEGIVNHIKQLLKSGASPESICVLARTNDFLFKIATRLYVDQIPVFLHSNVGFAERREIQDAIALLKFLVNPHDNKNLIQLLRSPWYRVPDQKLVEVAATSKKSYWETISTDASIISLKDLLKECSQVGITEVFVEAITLHGHIDLSLVYDQSGRRESNLWKLVTKLYEAQRRPDFNYVDFIAEIAPDGRSIEESDESDAVAAIEPQRVNLMTVHRSKGLQFDHVIVPDMNRIPRSAGFIPFLVDEVQGIWMVPVQIGDAPERVQSFVGDNYKRRRSQMELEESDRILYVALTRAVQTLFLSWNGRTRSNSWVGRINWDLEIGEYDMDGYSYQVVDQIPQVEDFIWKKSATLKLRAPYQVSDMVPVAHSVTHLVNESDKSKSNRYLTRARLDRSLEGIMVHELFETLRYQDEQDLVSRFGDRSKDIVSAVDYVRGLKTIPMMKLLKNGSVEWGFSLREKGLSVSGRIDLWGVEDGVAWVVDYKTGSIDYLEEAFKQLGVYAMALRRFGVKVPMKLAVIYPFARKVEIREAGSYEKIARELMIEA